jgi:hypothetical protein
MNFISRQKNYAMKATAPRVLFRRPNISSEEDNIRAVRVSVSDLGKHALSRWRYLPSPSCSDTFGSNSVFVSFINGKHSSYAARPLCYDLATSTDLHSPKFGFRDLLEILYAKPAVGLPV